MIDYIGIAIIIITVVVCISVVSAKAYVRGKEDGLAVGRLQVLNENLIRQQYKTTEEDSTVIQLRRYLEIETPRIDRVSEKLVKFLIRFGPQ